MMPPAIVNETSGSNLNGSWHITMSSNYCKRFFSSVTVEPVMMLFSMAYSLTSVVEQDFYVQRICRVDLNFSEIICSNLSAYDFEKTQVQIAASTFNQWNEVATWSLPIILSLCIGSWCDRYGRKRILLLGLFGKMWWSGWTSVIASQKSWPVGTVIWLSSLTSGITGGDVSLSTGVCSYLCDITSQQDRTTRITICDVSDVLAGTFAVAIGGLIFNNVVNQSYAIMFAINTSLLTTAFVYAFFRLKWRTNPEQKSLPSCCSNNPDEAHCLFEFCDTTTVIDGVRTFTKKRPQNGRTMVCLLTLSLALYMFIKDDKQSYLYTLLAFQWDVDTFSRFRTVQLAAPVLGTLIFLPLMSSWLHLSDTTVIFIRAAVNAISRIIFAVAKDSWYFYFGAALTCVGPLAPSAIRSMITKLIPAHESGKLLAILCVADTCMPIVTSVVYTQVYNATIETYPSAIFWVCASTQISVCILVLIVRYLFKGYEQIESNDAACDIHME